MAQKSPYRIRFNFWLDMAKSAEQAIADQIEILKNDRSFTQTVRDGIRLVCDLRNGKLDVLFELFPWVRAEFMEYMRDIQSVTVQPMPEQIPNTPQQADADQAWLAAEQERLEAERKWHEKRMRDAEKALEAERAKIDQERKQSQNAIQQQLERLEQLLLQQGNQPLTSGIQPIGSGGGGSPQNHSGLQSLAVPQFSTPTYDDDDEDDLILDVKQAKGDGQATQNFLRSMQALQQ